MEDADESFESHACVDVFGWELVECVGVCAVELDEDEVPDFEYVWVVVVDEVCGVSVSDSVVVDF